jgi:predicted nucleic acid-binding protein
VDTNVVLDVFMNREPWVESSAPVLRLAEGGSIEGLVAAHSVTTLHDLLARDLSRSRVRKVLADLLQVLQVVPVDEDRLRHALALDWPDFEDAVQAACAESAGADYLATRNKKDFRKSPVKALTPAELVALTS